MKFLVLFFIEISNLHFFNKFYKDLGLWRESLLFFDTMISAQTLKLLDE